MIGVFKTERLEDEAVLRNPFIRRISLTGCERIRELEICFPSSKELSEAIGLPEKKKKNR